MSMEVRAGLIELVRRQLAADGPTALNVTWFGGEPLMGLPVILDLADRFDRLVGESVLTKWDATMITNGLLATPKTMGQLRNLSSLQVTIDGPREFTISAGFSRMAENRRSIGSARTSPSCRKD